MRMNVCQAIANTLIARENCVANGNGEWKARHEARLRHLDKLLPSGAGFDHGSVVVKAESGDKRLVIETSFHHMNALGFYDGWTEHRVIITPTLSGGYDVRVTGRNRNDIKDYIAEVFVNALGAEVDIDAIDQQLALNNERAEAG